jgi:hypothetical protein
MWFTESAWPPIVVGCAIAAALLAVWFSSRRGAPLIAALVVLLLCVGVYFVEQSIITPAEEVEQAVLDLTHAFQQRDVPKTLSFFSARYDEGRSVANQGLQFVKVEDDLRITDLWVKMAAQNSRAESHFRASATVTTSIGGSYGFQPSRWMLTWQREGGEWRIIDVRRLNVVDGKEMPLRIF